MVGMVAKRRRELIDFAIYIAICLAVIASAIGFEAYRDILHLDDSDVSKAIGSVFATVILFPSLIRGNLKLHDKYGFWPALGLLFLVHLIVLAVLWHMDPPELLWIVTPMAEIVLGVLVLRSLPRRR
jgi:hypothetical protein